MGINPSNGLIEIILLKVVSLMDILKQPNAHLWGLILVMDLLK